MPEPRYFSIPSIVVGAAALRNEALNWTPWVRSLTQVPLAWTNSPAEIIAAWPVIVIRSRWARALTRRTQNPFSLLWKVTRSTRPTRTSVGLETDPRTSRLLACISAASALSSATSGPAPCAAPACRTTPLRGSPVHRPGSARGCGDGSARCPRQLPVSSGHLRPDKLR
jgi:hypothetical protein